MDDLFNWMVKGTSVTDFKIIFYQPFTVVFEEIVTNESSAPLLTAELDGNWLVGFGKKLPCMM